MAEPSMRKTFVLAAGVAILAFANIGIWQREQLLADGRVVLLKMAPVDPRSIMQGDYMRLRFEVETQAFPSRDRSEIADGNVVVALDRDNVGHFRRFDDGRPLGPGEIKLRYRVRAGRPNFATNAYFFEEGSAKTYEIAEYGEFRVAEDGEMILTGLRGERLDRLANEE